MNTSVRQFCFAFLPFAALISFLAFKHELINPYFEFSREEISQGELWRVVSGHFVHLNIQHCILNLSALCLIVLLVGNRLSVKKWMQSTIIMAVSVSTLLFFFSQNTQRYVGFSGVAHGLLALGLMYGAERFLCDMCDMIRAWKAVDKEQTAKGHFSVVLKAFRISKTANLSSVALMDFILFAALLLKVTFEQWSASGTASVVTYIGAPVIVDAHLFGVLSGVALAIIFQMACLFRRYET